MAAAVRVRVRTKDEFHKVRKAAKRGTITSLGHAGAYIRGIAKKSIKISPVYAPPGHPPHTRKGRLKHGIVYAVEKQRSAVLIGPTYSAVGRIAPLAGSSHRHAAIASVLAIVSAAVRLGFESQ